MLQERRGCGGIPLDHYLAASQTLLPPRKDLHTFSDVVSEAGLLFVFPEYSEIRNDLRTFISFGTTIDNLADEGPNIRSNFLPITNIEHFNHLRGSLLEKFSGNEKLMRNVNGFMRQAWSVEKYAHAHSGDFDSERKNKYRELINAVWTRMYISFAEGVLHDNFDTIGFDYSMDYSELIPTYE